MFHLPSSSNPYLTRQEIPEKALEETVAELTDTLTAREKVIAERIARIFNISDLSDLSELKEVKSSYVYRNEIDSSEYKSLSKNKKIQKVELKMHLSERMTRVLALKMFP